jgi:hypothetical protein
MPGQLAATIRAKYPGAYDDLDDAALESQVVAKYPQYKDLADPPKTTPSPPTTPERTWTDTAVDALPTIGGALGGLAGGVGGSVFGMGVGAVPGAIGGAAVGGAGGEGLRQSINAMRGKGALLTPGAALAGIGTEGAIQGAAEGAGIGVGKLLTSVAKQAYRGALRPSAAIRSKAPDVVERGLADRAFVGSRSAKEKAFAGVKASKAEADAAVAAQSGASPITSRETRQALLPEVDRAKREVAAGLPDVRRAIAERAKTIPKSATLQEGHAIARTLNDAADPAFKAANRGGAPVSLEHRLNKDLATAYSGAVKARVPGLAAINKTTADRMGLARALKDAAERPSVLANIVASGAGAGEFFRSGGDPGNALATALAIKGVSSPRTLSAGAIGLNELGKRAGLSSTAIRAALLALMQKDEPR